jgi:tetratricopeptide (TPR) repeat protein
MSIATLFEDAIRAQRSGRLNDAARDCQSVLRRQPNHAGALRLLGMTQARQGQLNSAATLLARAVALDPGAADLRNDYGMVLHALGRHEAALAQYQEAFAANPRSAVLLNNLGNTLASLRRPDEAIACFQQAVAIEPRYAEARNNLGIVLQAQGRVDEAIAQFEQALAARPELTAVRMNLATVLLALGHHEMAIAALRAVLAAQPEHGVAHLNLGTALRGAGRTEESIAHYQKACALLPGQANAQGSLGAALQELGRIEEAGACFDRAIELEPDRPSHYLRLTGNGTLSAGDSRIAAMEGLAADPGRLPEEEQVALHFALGKALADIGAHDRAFHHLLAGNALHRRRIAYKEADVIGRLERTRAVFTPALMRERQGTGDPTRRPIFIVGMPRSGSTLVEQMLACHPAVFAAGEVTAFREAVAAVGGTFPDNVGAIEPRRLATDYLARIEAVAARGGMARERITDKLPANFRYVGLIHLAMPHARIIHVRRDPIDMCLSCFGNIFEGLPFTYDLGELGRYYRAYERLMTHWRGLLPADAMLEVRYEELVEDFAAQARRIVLYCGLAWDDACLAFHAAARPVRTSSVVQVRRGIYRTSVGRWRPDDTVLRPLLEGLGGP